MAPRAWRQPRSAPSRRTTIIPTVALLVVLGALISSAVSGSRPAIAISDNTQTLVITEQNFAIAPGGRLRLKLIASGAAVAPVAVGLTTTTTTTTTAPPPTTAPTSVPLTSPDGVALPTTSSPDPPAPSTDPVETPPISTAPPGPDPLADVSIRIQVHQPVTNSQSIHAVLMGNAGPLIDIIEQPIRDVATVRPDGVIDIAIDEQLSEDVASETTLDAVSPGIYPISIQIRRRSTPLAETTTVFERTDTEAIRRGPVSIAIVMRVPSGPDADIVDELSRLAALAEATDAPLSVEMQPQAVATALADRPELATRLAAVLDAPDVLLATPVRPLDPSSAAGAELDDLYESWLIEGAEQLRVLFPSASIQTTSAIIDSTLTRAGGELLSDTGTELLITDTTDYNRLRGSVGTLLDTSLLSKVRLDDGSTVPLAVAEPNISELLTVDDSLLADEPTALRHTVAIAADVAVVRYGAKPDVRSVVLATASYTPPSPALVARVVEFTRDQVEVTTESVTTLASVTNTQFINAQAVTARLGVNPPVDLKPRIEAAHAARLVVADATSMLPANDARVAEWTSALDEVYRSDWSDADATAVTARVSDEADSIRTSILAPEPFPLTITGYTADLPIRIESRASVPLSVRVHLASDKLVFPEGDPLITLTPNGTTSVVVPIESRTNGLVELTLQLMTPAGNKLTDEVTISARFTSISGIGPLITGAFILVLLSWWFSYFRRHRARRRAEEAAASAARHPSGAHAADFEVQADIDQHDHPADQSRDPSDDTDHDTAVAATDDAANGPLAGEPGTQQRR